MSDSCASGRPYNSKDDDNDNNNNNQIGNFVSTLLTAIRQISAARGASKATLSESGNRTDATVNRE